MIDKKVTILAEKTVDDVKYVLCIGQHVIIHFPLTLNSNPYLILLDFLRQELKRKLRISGLSCAHSILTQAFRTHIHVTGSWGENRIISG